MSMRSISLAFMLMPLVLRAAFAQESATPPPDGAAIFEQKCAMCHGERGEGVDAVITFAGPSLEAVHDPGSVMTAMEVGPSHMPSFAWVLSVDEMHAVADYVTQHLAVIPLAGGDASEGGKLFRTYCAACHRTAVRGGALAYVGINAPELVDQSRAIIAGTIRSGAGPMPSFPPSVLTDHQVASIVEYIKQVQHPRNPGGNSLNWYGPVAEGAVAWVVMFGLIAVVGWIEKGGRG